MSGLELAQMRSNCQFELSGIGGTKCVGYHLCRLVCPTGAIGVTKRINKK